MINNKKKKNCSGVRANKPHKRGRHAAKYTFVDSVGEGYKRKIVVKTTVELATAGMRAELDEMVAAGKYCVATALAMAPRYLTRDYFQNVVKPNVRDNIVLDEIQQHCTKYHIGMYVGLEGGIGISRMVDGSPSIFIDQTGGECDHAVAISRIDDRVTRGRVADEQELVESLFGEALCQETQDSSPEASISGIDTNLSDVQLEPYPSEMEPEVGHSPDSVSLSVTESGPVTSECLTPDWVIQATGGDHWGSLYPGDHKTWYPKDALEIDIGRVETANLRRPRVWSGLFMTNPVYQLGEDLPITLWSEELIFYDAVRYEEEKSGWVPLTMTGGNRVSKARRRYWDPVRLMVNGRHYNRVASWSDGLVRYYRFLFHHWEIDCFPRVTNRGRPVIHDVSVEPGVDIMRVDGELSRQLGIQVVKASTDDPVVSGLLGALRVSQLDNKNLSTDPHKLAMQGYCVVRDRYARGKSSLLELEGEQMKKGHCKCCGVKRPPKTRWKHGLCGIGGRCATASETITNKMFRDGLPVGTCHPGIVQVQSSHFPIKDGFLVDESDKNGLIGLYGLEQYLDGKTPDDYGRIDHNESFRAVGHVISGASPMVSTRSPQTSRDAVVARVFGKRPTEPDEGLWEKMDEFLSLLPISHLAPWCFDDWLKTMPSRRKRALAQANDKYQETGWRPVYKNFMAFVKQEFLPSFETYKNWVRPKLRYKARIIQGPHDVTHVIAGPFLKPLTQRLKAFWHFKGPLFYASGPPEELDSWFSERYHDGMWIYLCDYTMFDCTHSKASWAFLKRWYRLVFGDKKELERVLEAWEAPRGRVSSRTKMRYRAKVMNASGRDDTALANAVLNGLVITLAIAAVRKGLSVHQLTLEDVRESMKENFVSIVGDDSLTLLSGDWRHKLPEIEAEIKRFGFKPGESAMTNDPFKAVYLGMRPYPCGNGWCFGPTLGRRLYKHHFMLREGDPYAWLHGVAEMEWRVYQHIPIIADMAENVLRLMKGTKKTPYHEEDGQYKPSLRITTLPHYSQNPHIMNYMAEGYGVSIAELRALSAKVLANSRLPVVWDDPVLHRFVIVDSC